jgi:hypothetical protein
MRKFAGLLIALALLAGCTKSVVVTVPPRVDLSRYETIGLVEFDANASRAISRSATRQFQEHLQGAQPGTPILDLGYRDALLNAIGASSLDADAIKRIGEKYGVAAVFLGEISYSEPKTDVKITDIDKLEGGMRTEIKGDISSRLVETRTGASVWSSSAWATRQIAKLRVSAQDGVTGQMNDSNPREEMVPDMIWHLTHDFRTSSERRRVK